MKKHKMWTKDEVKKVQKLWNDSTLDELASDMRVTKQATKWLP